MNTDLTAQHTLNTSGMFYILAGLILFLLVMTCLILFDVSPSFKKPSSSSEQMVADIFTVLFFSLLVVGLCVLYLPSLANFKALFGQIGSVTYVLLYTIFAILFYTLTSPNLLTTYSHLINTLMFGLGAFSFYKGAADNYVEKFSIQYERIKMLVLLFCFITLVITFYNINPGDAASAYFGQSLLVTIVVAVFAFLYVVVLMTLPTTNASGPLLATGTTVGMGLFLLFLATTTILITVYRDSFFANKTKSSAILIMLLVVSVIWSLLLGMLSFPGASADTHTLSLFKHSMLVLFGLVITGMVLYFVAYNVEHLSSNEGIVSFALNLALLVVVGGLIYKTIYARFPSGNATKNAFFSMIWHALLYVPCMTSQAFDWGGRIVAGQYHATTAGSGMMLGVAVALMVAYFKAPSLVNAVSNQGGQPLVNQPVFTDTEYSLGNYIDLHGHDRADYQYAISSWIYIDSVGGNSSAGFKSLLNFGNKPNLLYNAQNHTFMVTMEQRDLKDVTKNKLIDFDDKDHRILYTNKHFLLQKWNNVIVNYNGGTLDIFLNGELVKSSVEVIPYHTLDNLTIGENQGVKGGICNVVYFRHALTAQNIYFLYNTVKDKETPTLNTSSDTILPLPKQ